MKYFKEVMLGDGYFCINSIFGVKLKLKEVT